MRRALGLAAALLGACSAQEPQPDPVPSAASTVAPAPPPAVAGSDEPAPVTLAGEWKIAGIDGQEFNESYGLALSASEREIWWEPRCAGAARGYTIEGAVIRIGRAPSAGPPPPPGAPPQAVCAIGLPDRLDDVMRALDSATVVRRTPANGVELSGGGHSLLLFGQ